MMRARAVSVAWCPFKDRLRKILELDFRFDHPCTFAALFPLDGANMTSVCAGPRHSAPQTWAVTMMFYFARFRIARALRWLPNLKAAAVPGRGLVAIVTTVVAHPRKAATQAITIVFVLAIAIFVAAVLWRLPHKPRAALAKARRFAVMALMLIPTFSTAKAVSVFVVATATLRVASFKRRIRVW